DGGSPLRALREAAAAHECPYPRASRAPAGDAGGIAGKGQHPRPAAAIHKRMGTHEHELEIELLLRHRAWLRALAARLVGPGLADDLAQETWVAALRRPPDPARPAKPWLAAVAKRLALRLRGRTEAGAP